MKRLSQLPHDIIVDILLRVPVKSLIRFKSVCKPWRSLISDPQFAKLHLRQSQQCCNFNPDRVLLSTNPIRSLDYEACSDECDDGQGIILELDYPAALKENREPDVEFMASCNGLVCLVIDGNDLILWNPSIRESRELPRPSIHKSAPRYGLGYDFSIDDYKVLSVACCNNSVNNASNETKLELLSLKTNIWRRIPNSLPSLLLDGRGIFLNGALHWLGISNELYGIVSFDLAEEKFREVVPLPNLVQKINVVSTLLGLGISDDWLCLFYENDGPGRCHEGWLMKEYGTKSSWTRLFSVPLDPLTGYEHWQNALRYTKTGKLLMDFDGSELVMYDSKEQIVEGENL